MASIRSRLGSQIGVPSTTALFFALLSLLLPVVFGHRLLSGDGDLARHLVLGSQVLENGVVFADVFSHTRAGEPFIAYEWLSEVLLRLVEQAGGLAAVTVLAGTLIAGSVALVVAYLRPRVEPVLLVLVAFVVIVLTGPHWIARPHLFTFLGLGLLLHVATQPPSWKRRVALVVLFAVWANFHPGFLYGLVMLGAVLVGDAVDVSEPSRMGTNGIALLAAGAGSLIHPLGWGLHREVLRHLADQRAIRMVDEFASLDLSSAFGLFFFACVALLIVALAVQRRDPSFSALLPFLAALLGSLLAQRNVPLFALFAVPLLVGSLSEVIEATALGPIQRLGLTLRGVEAHARTTPWILATVVLLFGLAAGGGRLGGVQAVPDAFSPRVFPVEAVSRAREAGLDRRRMFNEYVWGGYVLYAWPEQRVYIDSMANFYGGDLMEEYRSVMSVQEGWREILREREIDLLLVESTSRLAVEAEKTPEWSVWHEDETAVVLVRDPPAAAS